MFLVSYLKHMQRSIFLTQPIFTCSMSTIETLEKDLKYVQRTNVTIKTPEQSQCYWYLIP